MAKLKGSKLEDMTADALEQLDDEIILTLAVIGVHGNVPFAGKFIHSIRTT